MAIAALVSPAAAIPSPELVVGSISSLSQLAALVAATLGGGTLLAGASRAQGASAVAVRRAWRLVLVFGLIALTLAAALAWVQTQHSAERRARLEATLLRPAARIAGDLADPSLKELNFAAQIRHPLGLATTDAQRVIDSPSPNTVIVDVREDAEAEMGSIPGAVTIRGPDFNAADPAIAGKTLVFVCHNGNRSSAACDELSRLGIDCRFIVGGLEKWVVESRPMTGLTNRKLGDLRAIPDYPNRDRLFDTAEVHEVVATRPVQFVDVRYPGEFATGHLPNAINIPVRKLTRAELDARLTTLPRRPIILPCYDRRSCFFAEMTGLALHRAGHEVLGRYTVPFEYFVAPSRPPHVEAWIAEQNTSLWTRARQALATVVARASDHTGLALAIVLLALLSRLLVLPVALKSERDQRVAHANKAALSDLKTSLADDPVRLRRALIAFNKTHNLTPGRNLLALAFLPVLTLAVGAVADVATSKPQSFAWLPSLAEPDPYYLLPTAFAVLLTAYVIRAFITTAHGRKLTMALCLPVFVLPLALLPSASTLYLAASAALLLLQRLVVDGAVARAVNWPSRLFSRVRPQPKAFLPLAHIAGRSDLGNKASRLAILQAQGIAVPRGVVLDREQIARFHIAPIDARTQHARRIAQHLGAAAFAVRSSATGEDGTDASFAGVFESVLDVTATDLPAAIATVAASFDSARADAYAKAGGAANILIQPMIAARHAGVLFTRAPDAPGQMLIECVTGTGDALVSGRATPTQHRFGRQSGAAIDATATAPIDFALLIALARRIEQHFGGPQDIEWAHDGRRFVILQSRDITAATSSAFLAAETDRLLSRAQSIAATTSEHFPPKWLSGSAKKMRPNKVLERISESEGSEGALVLETTDLTEQLPRPTRLSLSLMNSLWLPGRSVDLACRRLGLDYGATETTPAPYLTALGRLVADPAIVAALSPRTSRYALRRLMNAAPTIAADMRRTHLPALRRQAAQLAAIDPERLATADLLALWRDTLTAYTCDAHTDAEVVNILAHLVVADSAEREPARPHWHCAADAVLVDTTPAREKRLQRLLGHRASLDYELASPRLAETPGATEAYAARLSHARAPSTDVVTPGSAADLQALKEDAKHEVLRFLAVLRTLALALDQRFDLGGLIFHLDIEEVTGLSDSNRARLAALARQRRDAGRALAETAPLPSKITVADLERIGALDKTSPVASDAPASAQPRCKGRGTRVAGRREAAGRIYVATQIKAETGAALDDFRTGDILVTPLVHPDWLPYVMRAGGVVSEIGGWLSHVAIVARERDIAMIVGVPNAGQFVSGERVRLLSDGRIIAETDAAPHLVLVAAQ